MINFQVIENYIMSYAGVKYKKPLSDNDDMVQLMKTGKKAREEFIKLGDEVVKQFPDLNACKCTGWVNQGQIVPDYFWIQLKKKGYEKCPSSISLAAKKVGDLFHLYVAVEIKDHEASIEDFNRHNKLIHIPFEDHGFYLSGDNEAYFNIKQNKQYAQKLIEDKVIAKVRIQKDIKPPFNQKRAKAIIAEIIQVIQRLEVYYNKILQDYEKEKQKYSVLNNINQEIDNVEKYTNDWVIICNPAFYDVLGAFKNFNCIEWKQSTNIQKGDTVYIYLARPYKEIRYKCRALEVDLKTPTIDDSEYVLDGDPYKDYGRYVRLELVTEYNENQCPYTELKKHGLKSVQGPSRASEELSQYMSLQDMQISRYIEDEEDAHLLSGLDETLISEHIMSYEYQGTIRKKQEPTIRNNVKLYPRSKKIAINALAHANYSCEVDPTHPTFMRKHIAVKYSEPHHLVPLAYSDAFTVSLDVEENIVSLCSNCHNQLHYGRDIEKILKQLYEERIAYLNKVGIDITFQELLEMYSVTED